MHTHSHSLLGVYPAREKGPYASVHTMSNAQEVHPDRLWSTPYQGAGKLEAIRLAFDAMRDLQLEMGTSRALEISVQEQLVREVEVVKIHICSLVHSIPQGLHHNYRGSFEQGTTRCAGDIVRILFKD